MTARPPIYLASTSPRRRLILTELGIAHTPIHPGVDDGVLLPGAGSKECWPAALAYLKARAGEEEAARRGSPPGVVIGADTIVLKGRDILGQPRDEDDAARIIRALRGGSHRVITGVALVHAGRRDLFLDAATVTVGAIDDATNDRYARSGGWRGKAGGYNLAERLAEGWPIRFEGDPRTIMGLPGAALAARLERFLRYS